MTKSSFPSVEERNREAFLWDNRRDLYSEFTPEVLFAIARNESAAPKYRKFAVELLLESKHSFAKHPDLRDFVKEIEVEYEGIVVNHPAPDIIPMELPAIATASTSESVTTKELSENPPKAEVDAQ